jgi:drug/metabolite transporter (DMT)-like permease
MPAISLAGAAVILALAWLVVAVSLRTRAATTPEQRVPRNRPLVVVAALFAVAAVVLALVCAWIDFHETKYKVAWLVLGPAAVALAGLAYVCWTFSLPRPHRGRGFEALAWLLCLGVLGIGGCYGSMFLWD